MDAEAPDDERILCADDMCTGIVDATGRCGTCGRQGAAELARVEPVAIATNDAPRDDEAAVDPDERVPCPDGMCTGILDADGVCGTCGCASENAAAAGR